MDEWTPLQIEPERIGGPEELVERLRAMRPGDLTDLLVEEKAIVFRGFDVTPETCDEVLGLVLPHRVGRARWYGRCDEMPAGLRVAAEERSQATIQPHNAMSHNHAWPARLVFYCCTAPTAGGETLIVDGASWLAALDAEVRERFASGVRYEWYLHDGPGPSHGPGESWQNTFDTTRREEVEVFLDGTGDEWFWKADGGIQVSRIRPATSAHPVTGTEVWFNQVHRWYPAGHGDADDAQPWNVTFSDGSPIPEEYVAHICNRAFAQSVDVEWNQGDMLLLDNVALAHGRRPFTGRRRVWVAMSD